MRARQVHLTAFACLVAVGAAGCSGEDAEHLSRIGGKIAAHVHAGTATVPAPLASGWQALSADLDRFALDVRVGARLRWDKSLVGADIHVHADGGIVELTGAARDLDQRRRAVELAESTAGVDKVTDLVDVPHKEP